MITKRLGYKSIVHAAGMVFLITALCSCSTIPEEVVKLSYTIGQDMDVLRASYKTLIHEHYETLRSRRQDYLDNKWKPAFIKNWIANGHLVQIASGKEVYSESKNDFVAADPTKDASALLDNVNGWAQEAVDAIAKKRQELIAPLDSEEQELTSAVDDAFAQIIRGNATITAHLNSLRKVQAVQDNFLQAADMKDLRSKINEKLSSASERADTALKAIEKADGKLTNATEKLKTLKNIK